MKHKLVFLFLLISAQLSKAQSITILEQGKAVSIRGLSIVNDKTAWVSASKGHVALSTNRGKTWAWQQIEGFEKSDFRDIEAFSDKEAIIMSSGTPALILKTIDGGDNWNVCYRNDDNAWFLDGMAFIDKKHGFVMGDPIEGEFILLETQNGGNTWTNVKNPPKALKNEAAFAASGTSVITRKGNLALLTGGAFSRLLYSTNANWTIDTLPIKQGQASRGGFSVACSGNYTVIVGGDYQDSKSSDSVACYRSNNKRDKQFRLSNTMPSGYQSCVCYINKSAFISTGPSGSNLTINGGLTWTQIDVSSYNVCKKSKTGNLILLAGDNGKIAVYKK